MQFIIFAMHLSLVTLHHLYSCIIVYLVAASVGRLLLTVPISITACAAFLEAIYLACSSESTLYVYY